jgi:mannan endo-1,4-beta-mannosidase
VVEEAILVLQPVSLAGLANIRMTGIANVSRVSVLTYIAMFSQLTQILPASASSTTLTTKVSSTTATKTTTTKTTTSASATGFPTTNGLKFEIDGKTSYFAGSNAYWIGFLTNNDDVDLVFDHMDESGLRILRVWGFNDVNTVPSPGTVYYQLLKDGTATINTGADGLQRLDYVVASAEARNVKLIINFVNNWSDYGGMAAYVTAFGGTQTSWYTNTAAQTAYRTYIKAVVSRYINSPAVFAWELANEPRCKGCDTSVLYNWIKSTSAYIKSLDSKHMVAIGDGISAHEISVWSII